MKRNPRALIDRRFDLLIIGGGIHGACAAWDAALRGLAVALIEKGDFGSGTSSQSQKTIHGGLRYLQQADFRRVRESIRERTNLMRIAPHLIHPFPCLMPIYGHFAKGREVMSAGLILNDIIGFDRNHLPGSRVYIPRGRVISRRECLRIVPEINANGLTGGALWYDCQAYNTERLVLSFIHSAVSRGAEAANYVEATGFLIRDGRVTGVRAVDLLNGEEFDIQARMVLNNSGPWVNQLLNVTANISNKIPIKLARAICLVVNRQRIPAYGLGISSTTQNGKAKKPSRLFFITPWRTYSLAGTFYAPNAGTTPEYRVTEEEIDGSIAEFNSAFPALSVRREDISFVYGGLLPMDGVNKKTGEALISKHYRVIDHTVLEHIEGLLTVIGVKYTTARKVAERTIDQVFKKLGYAPPRCLTDCTPIYGGNFQTMDQLLKRAGDSSPAAVRGSSLQQLLYNYGSAYTEVVKYVQKNDSGAHSDDAFQRIKAEIIFNVREEMAVKLADVVLRRTELGSAGNPGITCLAFCASVMADELKWDKTRIDQEVSVTNRIYIPG